MLLQFAKNKKTPETLDFTGLPGGVFGVPKGIRTPDLSLRESHGRVFYYPLKSSKILDFTGFFKIIVLIISLIKSANFMPYFSFILANAKIFWGHHSVNMILVTSVILQLSSFFKWFIRRLILLYRCSLSVSSYIQILKGQVFRLHILALRTRSLPRSKSGQFLFNDFFFLYFLSLGFPHDRNNPRSPDVPAGLCHKAFHYPQRDNHTS